MDYNEIMQLLPEQIRAEQNIWQYKWQKDDYNKKVILDTLYILYKLPIRYIAVILDTSKMNLYHWLRKFNIPRMRKHRFTQSRYIKALEDKYQRKLPDMLRILYVDNKLSIRKVAEQLSVSTTTIYTWLSKYGIALSPRNKTALMEEFNVQFDNNLEDVLKVMYIDNKMSSNAIANELEIAAPTIKRWLHVLNIPMRNRSQAAKLLWQDPEFRNKMMGNRRTLEHRKRLSDAKRKWWREHAIVPKYALTKWEDK